MYKQVTLLTFTVLLVGCTGGLVLRKLPANHPANPEAATAPLPPRSTTLAIDAAAPAQATLEEPPADVIYACPMHPEVRADQPGQSCPKCGMGLVSLAIPGEEP